MVHYQQQLHLSGDVDDGDDMVIQLSQQSKGECKLSDDGGDCDDCDDDLIHVYEHIEQVELNTRYIKAVELDIKVLHIEVIHIRVVDIRAKHIMAEHIKVIHIVANHTEVIHIKVKAKHNFNSSILMEDILTIDRLEVRNTIQVDTMLAVEVDINLVDNQAAF